jgi:hypothetical protein
VIHVQNPPFAFILFAQRCSAGQDYLMRYGDAQIVFHPYGVAYRMMSTRCDGKLRRRTLLKVSLPVIIEGGFASVEVSSYREQHNVRIKTVGKGGFIRTIEGLLASCDPFLQLGDSRLHTFGFYQKSSCIFLCVNHRSKPGQQVDSENTVDLPPASAADCRKIDRR